MYKDALTKANLTNLRDQAGEVVERVEENIAHLPIMSVGLAFILGMAAAGIMAMAGIFHPRSVKAAR